MWMSEGNLFLQSYGQSPPSMSEVGGTKIHFLAWKFFGNILYVF